MNNYLIRTLILCLLLGIVFLIAWFYWPASKAPIRQVSGPMPAFSATPSRSPSATILATPPTNASVDMQAAHRAEVKREQAIFSLTGISQMDCCSWVPRFDELIFRHWVHTSSGFGWV
jgi:hypothetical protein